MVDRKVKRSRAYEEISKYVPRCESLPSEIVSNRSCLLRRFDCLKEGAILEITLVG